MKKYYLLLLLMICLLPQLLMAQEFQFEIKGEIEKPLDHKWVQLLYYNSDSVAIKDTAKISKGKFSFRGKTNAVRQAWLVFRYETGNPEARFEESIPIYAEPGLIRVSTRDSVGSMKWEAGAINKSLFELYVYIRPFYYRRKEVIDQFAALSDEGQDEPKRIEQKKNTIKKINDEYAVVLEQFVRTHPDHLASIDALNFLCMYRAGASLESLFESLSPSVKNSAPGREFGAAYKKRMPVEF